MDFGQLTQYDASSVAKNVEQLLQGPPNTLRGFEHHERHTGRRGTGNQSQPLSSLPGQETER